MIGSNVSPLHPKKSPHVTHTATVFLKAEKSEENVAKNKTVTTVIQCVCSTCLDFLVPLKSNVLELLLISNIKRLKATMLAKKEKRSGGKRK